MLLLLGTIVGAGIFGVPAMIGAWGIIPSTIAFIILTVVAASAHLLYTEAIIRNKKHSRLAGQASYWIGKKTSALGGFVVVLQVFGGTLAYIILGGEFLAVLASMIGVSVPLILWQLLFWLAGALLVLYGIKLVSRVESYLTWLLVAVIVFIVGVFSMDVDPSAVFVFPTTWTFEPYGIFLFALLGVTSIPEAVEVVKYRKDDARKAVLRGTIVAAVLTYGFGIATWMASGGDLSRDPADIIRFLPPVFAFTIPLFGFLAVTTSFITSSLDLKNMFHEDYAISSVLSWIVALGVPLALLFLTSRDFLSTIGLVGSVFGATTAVIVSFVGRAALRSERKIKKYSTLWIWGECMPFAIALFLLVGGFLWVLTR